MDARELEAPAPYDGINSLKKGIWSSWEDSLLVNYIALHGEGRWNYVARDSGLKRTGKSCRLRWKNYLCPTVRRGDFTAEEQRRIADLHRLLGNRWSKIAEFLWGRTDNEIKNYWRTRAQKQTKHLKYDTESVEVREFTRIVRLSEQIHASNNNNNNLMMNEAFGSEALQMDYWPSSFSCEAVKAREVATSSDSLSMIPNNDCEFFSTDDSFEPNFGEHYYDPLSPNSESPGCWFSYGELSNMLLNDDWCNF